MSRKNDGNGRLMEFVIVKQIGNLIESSTSAKVEYCEDSTYREYESKFEEFKLDLDNQERISLLEKFIFENTR